MMRPVFIRFSYGVMRIACHAKPAESRSDKRQQPADGSAGNNSRQLSVSQRAILFCPADAVCRFADKLYVPETTTSVPDRSTSVFMTCQKFAVLIQKI
jgi:hypothetical protein